MCKLREYSPSEEINIGDVVTVKDFSNCKNKEFSPCWNSNMSIFCHKSFIVKGISNGYAVLILNDSSHYFRKDWLLFKNCTLCKKICSEREVI